MSETNAKELANDGTESQPKAPDTANATAPPRRRSRSFRQELLKRLPILSAPKWQATQTWNVYQELQGIVDLDADVFLEPLEPITEKHNE
jgi:hypothetical protein